MKKSYLVFVILLLILVGCSNKARLSERIIAQVDKNCIDTDSCQISLNDITDFKWDKCVIFSYGSSSKEINEALGVEYNGVTDGHNGIVFAYDNKIAYEETFAYDPDHSLRFQYNIEKQIGGPTSVVYTYDNAILKGTMTIIDIRNYLYYYTLTAVAETK